MAQLAGATFTVGRQLDDAFGDALVSKSRMAIDCPLRSSAQRGDGFAAECSGSRMKHGVSVRVEQSGARGFLSIGQEAFQAFNK